MSRFLVFIVFQCLILSSRANAGFLDWLSGRGDDQHAKPPESEATLNARSEIESFNKTYKNCSSLVATGELATDFSGDYYTYDPNKKEGERQNHLAFDKEGKLIDSSYDLNDSRISPMSQLAILREKKGPELKDSYSTIGNILSHINVRSRFKHASENMAGDSLAIADYFSGRSPVSSDNPLMKCFLSNSTSPTGLPRDESQACTSAQVALCKLLGPENCDDKGKIASSQAYEALKKDIHTSSMFIAYAYDLSLNEETINNAITHMRNNPSGGHLGGIMNAYLYDKSLKVSPEKLDDLNPEILKELSEAREKKALSPVAKELISLKVPLDIYFNEAKFETLRDAIRQHCAPVVSDIDAVVKEIERNRSELLRVSGA